jgi:hypothetical protein
MAYEVLGPSGVNPFELRTVVKIIITEVWSYTITSRAQPDGEREPD